MENDTKDADAPDTPLDAAGAPANKRDFDAEARSLGWLPADEFKGDPAKCVDAKTFVDRADTFMPFIKKDRDDWKRKFSELQHTVKQASAHFSKVEERAYTRALADLEAKHADAVETGDVAAARAAMNEIGEVKAEIAAKPKPEADEPGFDPVAARREINAWVEDNDWYVLDDAKRRYADMQAEMMGPAKDWQDGNKAWLAELGKRVDRKFADRKPNITNGGGNRPAPGGGSRSFNDLPAEAKAACDKFVKAGILKSREDYVKSYQFD